MNCVRVCLFCCLLGAWPVVSGAADQVLITEIMYQPASLSTNEEWIEIYNAGTNTVNLQGWRFSQGIDFTFTNSFNLAPGTYAVACANYATFSAIYGSSVPS